ncbi:MAG: hypothetical protein WAX48_10595 [Desulfosalsimonadaceae bacterium]
MAIQSNNQISYEQELIKIIHRLPVERIAQIVDFARYIQSQTGEDCVILDDECEEEILADEAHWDTQFAGSQDGLKRMAELVRSEIRSGHMKSMIFTKNGRMTPG